MERVAARPGHDRPLPDGEPRVGDDELLVEVHPGAQPAAVRAGPVGAVEGEHPRGEFGEADAAVRAGVPLAEEHLLSRRSRSTRTRPSESRGRRLQGVAQALPDPLLDDEAVDDHVDVMALVLVEGDLVGQLPDLAVHADADVTLPAKPASAPSGTRPSCRGRWGPGSRRPCFAGRPGSSPASCRSSGSLISLPHWWQWGTPIRAKRRRR